MLRQRPDRLPNESRMLTSSLGENFRGTLKLMAGVWPALEEKQGSGHVHQIAEMCCKEGTLLDLMFVSLMTDSITYPIPMNANGTGQNEGEQCYAQGTGCHLLFYPGLYISIF